MQFVKKKRFWKLDQLFVVINVWSADAFPDKCWDWHKVWLLYKNAISIIGKPNICKHGKRQDSKHIRDETPILICKLWAGNCIFYSYISALEFLSITFLWIGVQDRRIAGATKDNYWVEFLCKYTWINVLLMPCYAGYVRYAGQLRAMLLGQPTQIWLSSGMKQMMLPVQLLYLQHLRSLETFGKGIDFSTSCWHVWFLHLWFPGSSTSMYLHEVLKWNGWCILP